LFPAGLLQSRAARIAAVLALALCTLVVGYQVGGTTAASTPVIWKIVDSGCNRGGPAGQGLTCRTGNVDAVLKDRCGATHFLLIPTVRRVGVESPELLRQDEPNYFADAWDARELVVRAGGRDSAASDEIGLAINSRWGRSQRQLHIHIDFVDPPVRQALHQWALAGAQAGDLKLAGHDYHVMHLASLQPPTPFVRLAPASAAALPDRLTIAVIGDGGTGFFLLSTYADVYKLNRGHAEELLVPKACGG
jgi:CDP-diacylglycerol pyrophosphatase